MKDSPQLTRRRFINATTKGLATIPVLALLDSPAWAATRLEESHGTAVALAYKHDASQVDATANPMYKPDQTCANCVQYKATADDWGTCNLFPGFEVAGPGWCKVWAKQP